MPTYGYQCEKCGHQFQVFQKMSDTPVSACPECRGKVKRLLYPVGVVFKGTGWHITDYRKPEKSEKNGDSTAPASSEPAKSDTPKTDSAGKSEPAATSG
ncbi:MAG TPA: FmdB family zinc ribbon protein [Chthonomonadaceae bacterium]|nr:FmdB family zinc ribbon protein [Chthonomonadaceae bacterium]